MKQHKAYYSLVHFTEIYFLSFAEHITILILTVKIVGTLWGRPHARASNEDQNIHNCDLR